MESFGFITDFAGFVGTRVGDFGGQLWNLITFPNLVILFGATILGIVFGAMPGLTDVPPGCPFHPRCPEAIDICRRLVPPKVVTAGRDTACWLYADSTIPEPLE